jgi:hypothetical protein
MRSRAWRRAQESIKRLKARDVVKSRFLDENREPTPDPTTYPSQELTLRWYLGFGANIDWPESWYKKLTAMSEENLFATIRLLNQKSFRAPKRKEIYDRVVAWLNDEGELGKWDIINLRNQYIDLECSRCSHHIYWSR